MTSNFARVTKEDSDVDDTDGPCGPRPDRYDLEESLVLQSGYRDTGWYYEGKKVAEEDASAAVLCRAVLPRGDDGRSGTSHFDAFEINERGNVEKDVLTCKVFTTKKGKKRVIGKLKSTDCGWV